MSHKPATPNEGKCPVCGVPGRIVGRTTKHFESDFEALLAIERAKAFEEAAAIAAQHAMEYGPSEVFTMGGHAIAKKILAKAAREGK